MKKEKEKIVENWKKKKGELADEENPAGSVELDDDDLEGVAGGAFATESSNTSGCNCSSSSTEGCGTCATGPPPTLGCCGTELTNFN